MVKPLPFHGRDAGSIPAPGAVLLEDVKSQKPANHGRRNRVKKA
jgi:hypothetical protein